MCREVSMATSEDDGSHRRVQARFTRTHPTGRLFGYSTRPRDVIRRHARESRQGGTRDELRGLGPGGADEPGCSRGSAAARERGRRRSRATARAGEPRPDGTGGHRPNDYDAGVKKRSATIVHEGGMRFAAETGTG